MIRVGVLRGGTSNSYTDSLATGAYVLKHLPRESFEVLDIFLDKQGVWHMGGIPVGFEKLKLRVDVVWNALHGFYGEDGKIVQLLESLGIPYTGAGALSSAIAMNKKLAKGHLAQIGVKTPRGVYIENWGSGEKEQIVAEVVRTLSAKFSPPWIVEPISRGQGIGAMRAKTRDELSEILSQLFDLGIPALIEEEVRGKEMSVIVTTDFRGKKTYSFLPTEKGKTKTRLESKQSEQLQKLARDVHEGLALGPYSRTTATVTPKGHLYVIGVETMPALHGNSDLHHALASVGVTFKEFAMHLIAQALKRR